VLASCGAPRYKTDAGYRAKVVAKCFRILVDEKTGVCDIPVWGSLAVLTRVTGERPWKPEHTGRIFLQSQDWIDWWDSRGQLEDTPQ
jgi:hypothetical protein